MNTPLPKPSVPQPSQAGAPVAAPGPVVGSAPQPPVAQPSAPQPPQSPQAPMPPQMPQAPQPPVVQPAPAVAAGAPPTQQAPQFAAQQSMPPKSLSALSSMNSTQIPKNNLTSIPTDPSTVAAAQRQAAQMPPQPLSGPGSAPPKLAAVAPSAEGSAPATPPAGGAKPKFASVEKPMAKYAIIGAIVLVVVGLIGGLAYMFLGGSGSSGSVSISPETPGGGTANNRQVVSGEQTTIEYWGLWEPTEVMAEVIKEFEAKNPGVKVSYSKQSHLNYRERLQTAISSGNGPDVFRFHASWTPMLLGELKPIPNAVMSAAEFKTTYYPVAAKQLQANGQYVGIPMMYDGLALLYNKEMFNTASLPVPSTWAGVKEAAVKLVIKGSDGKISRGGIALGNATNVDHFSDILGLLMLQNGATLTQSTSQEVADALSFYTSFQKTDQVWSSDLPNSTTAFAREEVAMIIVPSWRIHEVMAQNPDLDFGVTNVPVIEEKLTWGSFWAEGINSKSKNQDAAAAFLKFLTQKETLEKFYDAASKVRAFGELYPRMDMAADLADNELIAPYLEDAAYSDGWYLSSFTHDNGINDQIIKYYEDGITAMVMEGKAAAAVQPTIDQGVSQVLRQYGVSGALAR